MANPLVNWTNTLLTEFKQTAYKARDNKQMTFEFHGNSYDLAYAGLLITFLDERFGNAKDRNEIQDLGYRGQGAEYDS